MKRFSFPSCLRAFISIFAVCGVSVTSAFAAPTPAAKNPAKSAPQAAPAKAVQQAPTTMGKQKWVTLPVRYADGYTLVKIIRHLMGVQGFIRYSQRLNMLFLKDDADRMPHLLALKNRLDIPQWQFKTKIYLVLAEQKEGKGIEIDKTLRPSFGPTLRMFRHYNRFQLKDAGYLQITNGHEGRLEMGGTGRFNVSIVPRYIEDSNGHISLSVRLSRWMLGRGKKGQTRVIWPILLSTTLMTQNGHTLVVGASRMNGSHQALIMILQLHASRPK